MARNYMTTPLQAGQTGHTKGGFFFHVEKVFHDEKPNKRYLIAIYPDKHSNRKIMACLDENARYLHGKDFDCYGAEG